jgi:hypothetical protein
MVDLKDNGNKISAERMAVEEIIKMVVLKRLEIKKVAAAVFCLLQLNFFVQVLLINSSC